MSVNSGSASSTALDLNYALTTSATTGQQTITLKNNWGTATASFTVNDPSPTITGISPSTWIAGNSYNITITGNNFGTAPSISITGPSGSISANVTSGSDTSIAANIMVPANSASGPATVTVTSTGFGGSGFFSGNGGNSPSSSSTTPQVVATTPTPQIMFNGQSISGKTNIQVFAGQKISLSVAAPSGSGLSITSQTWFFGNSADVVGGYNASTSGGFVVPVTGVSNSNLVFYFINPGKTESITVNVTYSNGKSASSTATFNVQGPTNVNITSTVGQTPLYLNSIENPTLKLAGVADTNAGIEFQATSNLPPSNQGEYSWVQTITKDTTYFLGNIDNSPTARYQCPVITGSTTQLDTEYPYSVVSSTNGVPSDTATDSPSLGLQFGETAWSFAPTMYLMWVPNADSTCNGGICSIPIPLARVNWSWSWDAISTLTLQDSTESQWILNACSKANSNGCVLSSPNTDPNQAYPTWSGTDTGGNERAHARRCEERKKYVAENDVVTMPFGNPANYAYRADSTEVYSTVPLLFDPAWSGSTDSESRIPDKHQCNGHEYRGPRGID